MFAIACAVVIGFSMARPIELAEYDEAKQGLQGLEEAVEHIGKTVDVRGTDEFIWVCVQSRRLEPRARSPHGPTSQAVGWLYEKDSEESIEDVFDDIEHTVYLGVDRRDLDSLEMNARDSALAVAEALALPTSCAQLSDPHCGLDRLRWNASCSKQEVSLRIEADAETLCNVLGVDDFECNKQQIRIGAQLLAEVTYEPQKMQWRAVDWFAEADGESKQILAQSRRMESNSYYAALRHRTLREARTVLLQEWKARARAWSDKAEKRQFSGIPAATVGVVYLVTIGFVLYILALLVDLKHRTEGGGERLRQFLEGFPWIGLSRSRLVRCCALVTIGLMPLIMLIAVHSAEMYVDELTKQLEMSLNMKIRGNLSGFPHVWESLGVGDFIILAFDIWLLCEAKRIWKRLFSSDVTEGPHDEALATGLELPRELKQNTGDALAAHLREAGACRTPPSVSVPKLEQVPEQDTKPPQEVTRPGEDVLEHRPV